MAELPCTHETSLNPVGCSDYQYACDATFALIVLVKVLVLYIPQFIVTVMIPVISASESNTLQDCTIQGASCTVLGLMPSTVWRAAQPTWGTLI